MLKLTKDGGLIMKKNENGFGAVEILVVIVIVGLAAAVGWLVFDRQNSKTSDSSMSTNSNQQKVAKSETDRNKDYLVVKQWGLRFKTPAGLNDVEYVIKNETVAFYGKPAGFDVDYRSDYKKQSDGKFEYATGRLYRSNNATYNNGALDMQREGKKVGGYYYYTEHAFSSLATGAGPSGLYFDASCDQDSNHSKCETFIEAENKAFNLFNREDGLLSSIELAK